MFISVFIIFKLELNKSVLFAFNKFNNTFNSFLFENYDINALEVLSEGINTSEELLKKIDEMFSEMWACQC